MWLKQFPEADRQNKLQLVASPAGTSGSLRIHQDAQIFLSKLATGQQLTHPLQAGRYAWLQVLRGSVTCHGQSLETGDGVAVSDEASLTIQASDHAEVMVFDLS